MATMVLAFGVEESGMVRTASLVIILMSSGTESSQKTSLIVALLMTKIHILTTSTQELYR